MLNPDKKSSNTPTPFPLLIRRTKAFYFRALTNFKFPEVNFKFREE